MANRPKSERRPVPESGFTLVEVTIALVLVMILVVGLTLALGSALRATRDNRTQRQATVLALEQIEFARSLDWGDLAVDPPVSATDVRLLSTSDRKLVGAEVDLVTDEPLVEDVGGLIATYSQTTLDGVAFDVSVYVSDVEAGVRRVTAFVEWTVNSTSHTHFTMSLISEVASS